MSVSSEITRLQTAVSSSYSAVSTKGGTLPASQVIANLPTAIESIPTGFYASIKVTGASSTDTVYATLGSVTKNGVWNSDGYFLISDVGETGTWTVYVVGSETKTQNVVIDTGTQITVDFSGVLPSAYQEVEYIQSSGTQYINTGIVPVMSSTKMYLDWAYDNNLPSYMDTYVSADSNKFGIEIYNSNFRFCLGTSTSVFTTYDFNRHTYLLDSVNKTATFDSTEQSFSSSATFSTTGAFFICGRSSRGGTVKGKVYEVKFFELSELVRHFIPCYRKSDSEAGMYDLVNDVFYTNAGSGTFVVGGDV